ncbi:MAG: CHAT domain-containing protein [Desulfobacterales bacterium]
MDKKLRKHCITHLAQFFQKSEGCCILLSFRRKPESGSFKLFRMQDFIVMTITWILISLIFPELWQSPGHAYEKHPVIPVGEEQAKIAELDQQLAHAGEADQSLLLIRRGEAYQSLGYLEEAMKDFRAALDRAKAADQPLASAAAAQSLGYLHFLRGAPDLADSLLRTALEEAKSLDQPLLAVFCANRLGTVLFSQNRSEEAWLLYEEALQYADRADDPGLEAGIRRNMARIISDDTRALSHLSEARKAAEQVALPRERTDLLLGIAAEAQRRETGESGIRLAFDCLTEALSLAGAHGTGRQLSHCAGRLGCLYEKTGQFREAMNLTAQALETARSSDAHDLLLLWEWQQARLLRAQGDSERAVAACRRAVYHIEAIRQDIPITYQDGRSSFTETLSPIYLGLADMLLLSAAKETGEERRQALLREARQAVERIKRSELTDYFRDPCVVALTRGIENLSPSTAVIYPIILPDRLELLLDMDGRLWQKSTAVEQKTLEQTVRLLTAQLRNRQAFEKTAAEVYDWLFRPVASLLEEHQVDTLVFVPDGVFRMFPVASLWDGKRFLAERFAIVTAPGMSLLDPAPLARGEMLSLMAGMSDPGPVIFDLPENFWQSMTRSPESARDLGVRGISVEVEPFEGRAPLPRSAKENPELIRKIRQRLALPGVDAEIRQISGQLHGTVLLNENFQLERFAREIGVQSFQVVHIASHGYFGGKPEQNFIMTYDRRLDMNQLEAMIKPKQLAATPVELIIMSACQTAEGDERSPLGLAGVVLKSGARSALGSLWPVSDLAAQEMLPAFYTHIKEPGVSKAEALRRTQISLMQKKEFRHPFYWSPFILIGNWL